MCRRGREGAVRGGPGDEEWRRPEVEGGKCAVSLTLHVKSAHEELNREKEGDTGRRRAPQGDAVTFPVMPGELYRTFTFYGTVFTGFKIVHRALSC